MANDIQAFHAVNRFGLGPKWGEIDQIAKNDPKSWVLAQLDRPYIPKEVAGFPGPNGAGNRASVARLTEKKANFKASQRDPNESDMTAPNAKPAKGDKDKAPNLLRTAYVEETAGRFLAQLRTTQPFIERLVMFWSNHFTVSIKKNDITGLVNAYEVAVIRPHILGKFSDMLLAVEQHPAMLVYLDNQKSVGKNSKIGRKKEGKNINENLAREILELHTLGVNGGYTQADIIALANMISGWGVNDDYTKPPAFAFHEQAHEPGPKILLGKQYAEDGHNEGVRALLDVAAKPATAKFIATKLARHFISDTPPESAINTLADTFMRTGGDLRAVTVALVSLTDAWAKPSVKLKTPYEFVLSSYRLMNIEPDPKQLVQGLEQLNYRVFSASGPNGYPDITSAWATGDGLLKRVEWSHTFAQRLTTELNPRDLGTMAYGPVMRDETRFIIAGAESTQDGIAFVLSAPEFQWR